MGEWGSYADGRRRHESKAMIIKSIDKREQAQPASGTRAETRGVPYFLLLPEGARSRIAGRRLCQVNIAAYHDAGTVYGMELACQTGFFYQVGHDILCVTAPSPFTTDMLMVTIPSCRINAYRLLALNIQARSEVRGCKRNA